MFYRNVRLSSQLGVKKLLRGLNNKPTDYIFFFRMFRSGVSPKGFLLGRVKKNFNEFIIKYKNNESYLSLINSKNNDINTIHSIGQLLLTSFYYFMRFQHRKELDQMILSALDSANAILSLYDKQLKIHASCSNTVENLSISSSLISDFSDSVVCGNILLHTDSFDFISSLFRLCGDPVRASRGIECKTEDFPKLEGFFKSFTSKNTFIEHNSLKIFSSMNGVILKHFNCSIPAMCCLLTGIAPDRHRNHLNFLFRSTIFGSALANSFLRHSLPLRVLSYIVYHCFKESCLSISEISSCNFSSFILFCRIIIFLDQNSVIIDIIQLINGMNYKMTCGSGDIGAAKHDCDEFISAVPSYCKSELSYDLHNRGPGAISIIQASNIGLISRSYFIVNSSTISNGDLSYPNFIKFKKEVQDEYELELSVRLYLGKCYVDANSSILSHFYNINESTYLKLLEAEIYFNDRDTSFSVNHDNTVDSILSFIDKYERESFENERAKIEAHIILQENRRINQIEDIKNKVNKEEESVIEPIKKEDKKKKISENIINNSVTITPMLDENSIEINNFDYNTYTKLNFKIRQLNLIFGGNFQKKGPYDLGNEDPNNLGLYITKEIRPEVLMSWSNQNIKAIKPSCGKNMRRFATHEINIPIHYSSGFLTNPSEIIELNASGKIISIKDIANETLNPEVIEILNKFPIKFGRDGNINVRYEYIKNGRVFLLEIFGNVVPGTNALNNTMLSNFKKIKGLAIYLVTMPSCMPGTVGEGSVATSILEDFGFGPGNNNDIPACASNAARYISEMVSEISDSFISAGGLVNNALTFSLYSGSELLCNQTRNSKIIESDETDNMVKFLSKVRCDLLNTSSAKQLGRLVKNTEGLGIAGSYSTIEAGRCNSMAFPLGIDCFEGMNQLVINAALVQCLMIGKETLIYKIIRCAISVGTTARTMSKGMEQQSIPPKRQYELYCYMVSEINKGIEVACRKAGIQVQYFLSTSFLSIITEAVNRACKKNNPNMKIWAEKKKLNIQILEQDCNSIKKIVATITEPEYWPSTDKKKESKVQANKK